MAFQKRREFVFVYSVKDANPNGDPLNANHPRYDADTSRVLVSDVRLKRTVRDQWLREGLDVFVDGEPKTLKSKIEELKKKFDVNSAKAALANCIDTKLFGVTFALGNESFSWTGPVQFKWGRSLHRAKAELVQGTAAFATKDDSEQRSFRNEYIVPFVMVAAYGIANQFASEKTGATEKDVDKIAEALWQGTINLITRSKVGHVPRLLVEVVYKEGFVGAAGALDERLELLAPDGSQLSENQEYAIRSPKDCLLDLSSISGKLVALEDQIESVKIWCEAELKYRGFDALVDVLGDKVALQTR